MGKHYISKYAICPCYRSEERQVIRCGVEQTTVHRVFNNASEAKEYKKKYCQHSFMQCPIYAVFKNNFKG